eukprot:14809424-Alexandrium_andersonii.AAC.1
MYYSIRCMPTSELADAVTHVEFYVDTGWAGIEDDGDEDDRRKSATGGSIFWQGMCVASWSATQHFRAQSSAEA